ncbi:peptidase M24 [Pisolithus orientalis]|uniref:peptidase M24 n=1 Tax=Pisolithus orientalis TaxID=936130 RepID=UPI00222510B8|nr:peptidase M24 [Pisolithus orientalis]KAI6035635.1 peptidase M24 [Pisolithus orientalis]
MSVRQLRLALQKPIWRATAPLRTCGRGLRALATVAGSAQNHKPSNYGQPLFPSHPHLLKPHELTPGIPADEYECRRRTLMDSLPSDSLVVLVAAPIKYMSGTPEPQSSYKFRQASDFWYLTGFEEPDAAVILEKTSNSRGYRMTLFSSGKDSAKEKWEGARTSFEDVVSIFRADDALPIHVFPARLKSLAGIYSNIYIDSPNASTKRPPRTAKSLLRYLRQPLAPLIAKLRSIKSKREQQVMRAAADISGHAFAKTMRFTQPGTSESAIAAHFEYLCSLSGSQRLAYVPVVASGPNALIIHYTSNNQVIQDGELILVDAGCEYNGYASDITRTYPASGSFTSAQHDLYTAVLTAQKALIGQCTETASFTLHELHRRSCDFLRVELNQLGFRLHAGEVERVLYPHFLSHPIGIDLHESSNFDRGELLKAGMVITIEPGIYVPPLPQFPKNFHNMGIRIEDEVLVGKEHPMILSVAAPKEVADVEGACQGLLGLQPL